MSESDRHFLNKWIREEIKLDPAVELEYDSVKESLEKQTFTLLKSLQDGLKDQPSSSREDYSIYTGTAGISLLYIQLQEKFPAAVHNQGYQKALELIHKSLKSPAGKRVSFLCGDAGLFAVAAVLNSKLEQRSECRKWTEKVISMSDSVVRLADCDEVLFGRAGYLSALLFLEKHLGHGTVPRFVIDEVVFAIFESGKQLSCLEKLKCPLMYKWHNSYYLGAAHGIAGIFFILMRTPGFDENAELRQSVKSSIEWLMTLRFPSGNYPSSLRSQEKDKLVHWCHGASGFIHMFIQAYRTYKDEKFLREAEGCADCIWERGLLKKGYGICHGVAGNGYAFLLMALITKDKKYLFRAVKFAEWIADYGKHGCREADRPLSLFEGLAGTIYFLVDMLEPESAEFPAFY